MTARLRAYLIPAAVFQSVIFGGAYGTGREIAEFVSRHGPVGGLLGLGVIFAGFTIILFLSFEIARRFQVYDYRNFFKRLVGPAWFSFEILFLIAVLLVLAVNGSAAGTILQEQFHINASVGVGLLFITVVLLNYFGREFVEQSMSVCMLALTAVLIVFCVVTVTQRSDQLSAAFTHGGGAGGWAVSGLQYTLYNAAVIPVLLFCARDLSCARDSAISATVAGIAGAFPALIFHFTFMSNYPAVLDEALPVYALLKDVAGPLLFLTYIIVLFAMMIQTVAGLLQGLIERLDGWAMEIRNTPLSSRNHALIAAGVLVASLLISRFGITAIIAKGYGTLAWGYLLVFVIPLVTIGVRLIWLDQKKSSQN